jgi:hypothetical protein
MKKIITILLVSLSLISYSQCDLTSSDTHVDDVKVLLDSPNNCNEIVIPDGVTINMDGKWDLSAYSSMVLKIMGSGSLVFSENGNGDRDELIVGENSVLVIGDVNNASALVVGNGGGQVRITHGSNTYKGNDFSGIIASGGINIGALPVEFLSFDISHLSEGVLLEWETATELNNNHFTIERSVDLNNFIEVDTVGGSGTSSNVVNYRFVDKSNLPTNIYYYRLKQTDFNGNYDYSNIVFVSIVNDKVSHVHPTVSSGLFNVDVISYENLYIVVTNSQGEVVISKYYFLKGSVVVDITDVDPGLYFIKIFNYNGVNITEKVIKK